MWLVSCSGPPAPAVAMASEAGPLPVTNPLLTALDVTFRFSGIVWMAAGEEPPAVDAASSCEWAMPTMLAVPFAAERKQA